MGMSMSMPWEDLTVHAKGTQLQAEAPVVGTTTGSTWHGYYHIAGLILVPRIVRMH